MVDSIEYNPVNPWNVDDPTSIDRLTRTFLNAVALHDSFWLRQTFRSMRLRTHPDADLVASSVMLAGAEEIVFDDGIKDAVTSPLTASLAVSGAGGVDAGPEAVSTWYEIFCIRKPDGTKNLLFSAAKAYLPAATSLTGEDGNHILRRGSAPLNVRLGQGFKPDYAGVIEFVDLRLVRVGAVAAGKFVSVSIRAGSATIPTGANLATSEKIDASKIGTTVLSIRFVFRTPLTVVAGVQYHLVLEGDYTASDTVYIAWAADTTAGTYANGNKSWGDAAEAWTADTDDDFMFSVYVANRTAAQVVMPTGYTGKCRVGWAYNNSSGDLIPFAAFDRLVTPLSLRLIASVTSTVPQLIDLSTFIPPIPVALSVSLNNSTINSNLIVSPVPDGYWSSNIGEGGARRLLEPGSAQVLVELQPILTEFHGMYAVTSAGTMNVNMSVWRW